LLAKTECSSTGNKAHMSLFETKEGVNTLWVSKHMIVKPKEHQTDVYVDATGIG